MNKTSNASKYPRTKRCESNDTLKYFDYPIIMNADVVGFGPLIMVWDTFVAGLLGPVGKNRVPFQRRAVVIQKKSKRGRHQFWVSEPIGRGFVVPENKYASSRRP